MVEGYFDRLPCDILHNIALMLPFDSIIQLKRSSKFWYNLLTDPKFVDLHLNNALEKPPGYLFTFWPEKEECYYVEQSGGDLSTSKIFDYSFGAGDPGRWAGFQPSGGLMCAYSILSNCFHIFNPDIGEEIQVPRDPKFKRRNFRRFIFSYSSSIKEYKILKFEELIVKREAGVRRPIVAEICTLGSNIWKEIEQNVPSGFLYIIDGYTHCQGNPFWMEKSYLHYFDLVSEKFHVIPGPPKVDPVRVRRGRRSDRYVSYMFNSLISMGDTIGYVHDNRLWVLEDITKGIWINKYNFSFTSTMLYNYYPTLTGTSENGHLFGYIHMRDDSFKFFSHDMGCTGFRIMEMVDLDKPQVEEQDSRRRVEQLKYIAPHVRSFVSPVRIMKMGNKLNVKERRVLDKLKLDYDATKDDLINKMYDFLEAYQIK